jgi:hypothetical protein
MKSSRFCFQAAIAAVVVLFVVSCAHMPAGMSPSTRPVKLDAKVLQHSKGESSYVSLLCIFPTGHPDYDAAIEKAIKKVPGGTAMINVRSYFTTTFLYIISVQTLTVEGDVIGD